MPTYLRVKIFWGETTREEMVLGAKRLGYWGETTRVENRGETTRGETTRGEMSWGERSCYHYEPQLGNTVLYQVKYSTVTSETNRKKQ